MINEFVESWENRKNEVEDIFKTREPKEYKDIVSAVIGILSKSYEYDAPDTYRITQLDYGDYQGTLLFIIGGRGYQTSRFWYVMVSYGSCSGCDTLLNIREDTPEKQKRIDGYMLLALHILQGLKELKDNT